jgi:hypothetical protein
MYLRGQWHYNINKNTEIIESSDFVTAQKLVKGGIFSLISTNMMYSCKHILKKPMPDKKYRLIKNRADREYLKNNRKQGLSDLFIVAPKR